MSMKFEVNSFEAEIFKP